MTDTENAITELMNEFSLELSWEFIPFSKSRNAKPKKDGKIWRSLNWFVTLKRAGIVVTRFDYSAGEGHTPAYKEHGHSKLTVHRQNQIAFEIENGFAANVLYGDTFAIDRKRPIGPDPFSVLASLVLDSSVLDYASFEDWANDMGYSDDSREAEKTYRECLNHALALRAAIGNEGLERLKEACQDY